jgi:hypothetical protein
MEEIMLNHSFTKIISYCLIFVFSFGLFGCQKPKSKTLTVTCTRLPNGQTQCSVTGTITWRVNSDLPGYTFDPNSEILVDVPDGWTGDFSNANLVFQSNYETNQMQSFSVPTTLVTTQVDSIEKNASVFALTVDGNNVTNALNSQIGTSDSKVSFGLPIQQTNCNLASRIYTFHIRVKDSTGITYFGSVDLDYQIPEGGNCNQATINGI